MSAEEVNEKFSCVVFFVPCRIAPPPFDADGYAYSYITSFIERLKIPFFSLGESVQARSYHYDSTLHQQLSKQVVRYLKVVADRSPIVGTRGNYSAEVLNDLGIFNAQPLGCPSLYVNGPELSETLLKVPSFPQRVSVCYSNYQGNAYSRIADILRMAEKQGFHYVEQMFGLVAQALYYPGKITAQDIHEARLIYQDLNPLLKLLHKKHVRYFTSYTLWKEFLKSMDFSFGARMHGLTPAIHAGKPAMFIAHDARVREMCEFFDLPFVAEQDLPATLDLEFFTSRCDYGGTRKRYRQVYQDFVSVLRRLDLAENFDGQNGILDQWTPPVDLEVIAEESVVHCNTNDVARLEQQILISSDIPDEVFSKFSRVDDISREGYIDRVSRRL